MGVQYGQEDLFRLNYRIPGKTKVKNRNYQIFF